eukprot:5226490-Amphidinium_carterae.1
MGVINNESRKCRWCHWWTPGLMHNTMPGTKSIQLHSATMQTSTLNTKGSEIPVIPVQAQARSVRDTTKSLEQRRLHAKVCRARHMHQQGAGLHAGTLQHQKEAAISIIAVASGRHVLAMDLRLNSSTK